MRGCGWKSPGRPDYERCEACLITRPVTAMKKADGKWACLDTEKCATDRVQLQKQLAEAELTAAQ